MRKANCCSWPLLISTAVSTERKAASEIREFPQLIRNYRTRRHADVTVLKKGSTR